MFIVFESIDGGGKGYQRIEVASILQKKGIDIKSAEFPIHDAFYEQVIHPALQGETKMNSASWVLAYLLDKTRYVDNIKPYLQDVNKLFLVDGYFTTTIAYQSLLMKQIEMNKLIELGDLFEIPKPDLAIFLDVDPQTAIARKHKEEGHEEGPDMFEKSVDKQRKLQQIFKKMVDENIYCPWVKIDGNGKPEEVTNEILKILKDKKVK